MIVCNAKYVPVEIYNFSLLLLAWVQLLGYHIAETHRKADGCAFGELQYRNLINADELFSSSNREKTRSIIA